ncbi:GNAT family N-acetyltransferase [Aquabacterium sp.]|uniref:GNAT family N-acetyltransferase n=1 Tax=Aquabacterium sp. TaxID=1872578 RepID=UPI002C70C802|nr:GNAT family N-acetyltransferase [Aquabacterium sp.]HSW04666.1 GNAT family N-acetyltransferase [Aquabacterium sp.]
MGAPNADSPAADGVMLRPMTTADLPSAHALSSQLHWPHRFADWEQALRHAEGFVAEQEGSVIGTALRWHWGPAHATIGLVIVDPAHQGQRIGHRLMSAVLDGLDSHCLLLHATPEGRGLYERLGFQRIGDLQQHQGQALPSPLVALDAGWRLRPAAQGDLPALQALDRVARGMPRDALIAELVDGAEASVVLDQGGTARGFGLLRRFGRGHVIGPVIAPDATGAQALIAHLSGLNAGRFTRIDIDAGSGLGDWVTSLGLARVDAPVTMQRGDAPAPVPGAPRLFAVTTQALG